MLGFCLGGQGQCWGQIGVTQRSPKQPQSKGENQQELKCVLSSGGRRFSYRSRRRVPGHGWRARQEVRSTGRAPACTAGEKGFKTQAVTQQGPSPRASHDKYVHVGNPADSVMNHFSCRGLVPRVPWGTEKESGKAETRLSSHEGVEGHHSERQPHTKP